MQVSNLFAGMSENTPSRHKWEQNRRNKLGLYLKPTVQNVTLYHKMGCEIYEENRFVNKRR